MISCVVGFLLLVFLLFVLEKAIPTETEENKLELNTKQEQKEDSFQMEDISIKPTSDNTKEKEASVSILKKIEESTKQISEIVKKEDSFQMEDIIIKPISDDTKEKEASDLISKKIEENTKQISEVVKKEITEATYRKIDLIIKAIIAFFLFCMLWK